MSLSTLSIRDAEVVKEDLFGKEVLHVRDPHALIQAAGYLKFNYAKDKKEGIYFTFIATIVTSSWGSSD